MSSYGPYSSIRRDLSQPRTGMPEARKTCIAAGNILKLHEPDRQWHNVIIYQAHIKAVYC